MTSRCPPPAQDPSPWGPQHRIQSSGSARVGVGVGGDRGEDAQCPPPAVPPRAGGAGGAEQRQDQTAWAQGLGWCRRGGCQATATCIWPSLLPGVEEPLVPIFTLCHLLRSFCSGRQEGTVSFTEHWEPLVLGWQGLYLLVPGWGEHWAPCPPFLLSG